MKTRRVWQRRGFAPLLVAVLTAGSCAPEPAPEAEGIAPVEVRLTTLDGRSWRPFETPDDAVRVFVFVRSDCPISNRYAPELARIADERAESVPFYLVYPDPVETPASIAAHQEDFGFVGEALRDPRHELVRLAGARITPEVAVFHGPELAYAGRIDDRYVDFGRTRPAPTRHDLEEALRAVQEGRAVEPSRTQAVGCFIDDLAP